MINVFRKHSRWLMIVIAILAIPFIFYFNKSDLGAQRAGSSRRLFGRDVPSIEVERGERMFELARDLGMAKLLNSLVLFSRDPKQQPEEFALNLLVLRHEADALGLRPSAAEAAAAVSNLPAFRGDTGFDMKRYSAAVQNYLGPRGFSEAQIEELAADQICLERIEQLIGAGVAISPDESKKAFEQDFSRVQLQVVRFNKKDVANEIKISDDEIKKYFEARQKELMSDEKRKVQFLALTLTDEQKKLAGKERMDALQKSADKANDIKDALAEKGADFSAVAARFQMPVTSTGDFTMATPDPLLKDSELAQAAFQLTKENPTSEPIQTPDGFYVLHLENVTPAQPLTLEQAKPKMVEAITAARERELLSTKAAKAAHDLRDALKAGESILASAAKLNLKLEAIPPFMLADELDVPRDQQGSPELSMLKRATAELKANEVSEPLPGVDGMMVAVVEKRDPPGAAQASKLATVEERMLDGKRKIMFIEWLRDRQRAAGIVTVNASSTG